MNTISTDEEVAYPGDRAIERRIKSLVRWNAAAMVVRANKYDANIGGHIATYASLATLLEVGYNHFFHGSHRRACGGFYLLPGARFAGRLLRGRIWKGGWARRIWKISGMSCAIRRGCLLIRIPG